MEVCDLPDVPGRIGETCGARSPRPVRRRDQEFDATRGQLGAGGVDIVHLDGELVARAGSGVCHAAFADELSSRRLGGDQVDERVAEVVYGGVMFFNRYRQVEDPSVELPGRRQVLDEQRDGSDTSRSCIHFLHLFRSHDNDGGRPVNNVHLTTI